MNYSTDSFIIDAGQFIQTIMFKAPYINGTPLNYDQTKRIFNAVHESVFNSIFPWANINNHPMDAIEAVYEGYQLRTLVDGHVYQYLGEDSQGNPQYSTPVSYDRVQHQYQIRDRFQSEHELPVKATPGALFLVGGDFAPEQWVTYLVHSVLEPIGIELKKVILQHAGTRRKFEWHFEYVSNGIFYQIASSKPAVIAQRTPELSEQELINRAILNQQARVSAPHHKHLRDYQILEEALQQLAQPKPLQRPELKFNVDIRPYSMEERFGEVLNHAAGLLADPKAQGAKLNITVTYAVQGYFDKLVTFINQFIEKNRLDVVANVRADWVRPTVSVLPEVDTRLQQMVNHGNSVHDQLRAIREKIVKANRVSDLDARELEGLAPELFRMGFTPTDMAELMQVDDPTLRFYGKDPMLINQNVIMMCLAIDRYLEGPALPQAVQVQKPMREIPLAAVNMNTLLIQELQTRLLSLNPHDENYEKAYRDIVAKLAKLGCSV